MLNLEPNPEQKLCIEAHEGSYVVISGPGSGKSTTLVGRHISLLSKGVMQQDILNLTFTAEAARNMVEKASSGLFDCDQVFRTFHSWALDFLKREKEHLPFKVTDTIIPVYGQDFQLMKDLLKTYPAITSFRLLKDRLSEWKRSNISPQEALEQAYTKGPEYFYACAYRDYERICREQGWLDFDSSIKESVKLLETNDDVRRRNQRKYISVDECQDTDVVQFQLLRLLFSGNIFAVGDENQLIYEWRSAVAGNLTNFSRTFPGAKTLYLGQNYRSTKSLVDFFKQILPTDNGIASHMKSDREQGVRPTFTEYFDDYDEANHVVEQIRQTNEIQHTAVIARTNRQLLTFQKRCMVSNIKSKIVGHKDLWHESEVKHLLDLAKQHKEDPRPASVVLTELIQKNNLAYVYRGSGNVNEKDPVENLNDLVKMSKNRTTSEFLDWLRRLTYARATDKNPILSLTTVHQAKGREWRHVYVIGCKQGLMPHKDGELLEENRIFFVACSRAADNLHISFYDNPSQFLNGFTDEMEVMEEYEQDPEYQT